jgi:hypothetical protein
MSMKKSWSICVATSALAWLLAFGASPADAYYPPLQPTYTYSSTGWGFQVTLPDGSVISGGGGIVSGTLSNFQINNGIMAWIHQDGSNYYVNYTTYDPFLGITPVGSQGPFTSVTQLQVMDGVVAFVATASEPGAVPSARYATYDPIKGWQNRTWLQGDGFTNLRLVGNQDGVVLRLQDLDSSTITGWELDADIYDAALGTWRTYPLFADQEPFSSLISYVISNATITITYNSIVSGLVTETYGYDYSLEDWYLGYTKPMAYFVAQPVSGPGPLWVWFTDMSITGTHPNPTSWNWQFGDDSSSTIRSPYHNFTSFGNFQVSMQISGPNGTDIYSKTIRVYPKLKSAPAVMHLLLEN